jgi:hypothetical protein
VCYASKDFDPIGKMPVKLRLEARREYDPYALAKP